MARQQSSASRLQQSASREHLDHHLTQSAQQLKSSAVFQSQTRRPMFDQTPQRQLITNKLSQEYASRLSPHRQQLAQSQVQGKLLSSYILSQHQQ